MGEERKLVEIYTDGACSGNPGPGGWGAVLRHGDAEKELQGWSSLTTNNRMELLAAIRALEALRYPCKVVLYTDSQYLKNGITKWLANWRKNGWRTAGRKPVKNQDLWMELDRLASLHDVEWRWLRGHAGHRENERADRLAREAIQRGAEGDLKEDLQGRSGGEK